MTPPIAPEVSKPFRRGLVVGKFAPLHLGHCLVIDSCADQCDEVILVSWAVPEREGCAVELRRSWLADLYPAARTIVVDQAWLNSIQGAPTLPAEDAPEVEQRRLVWWLCTEVLGVTVDAVFGSDSYLSGFAADLGAWFGHPVEAVLVDPQRSQVPISATEIRHSGRGGHRWLPVAVAASFVKRVAFLGGESSGKSTLAAACAEASGESSLAVAEYGRERWETAGGQLEYDDLLSIAQEQVRRESAACVEVSQRSINSPTLGIVFCDTTPLTTLLYCLDMFGNAEVELELLAQRAYDMIVLCAPDFEFVQDGTRRDDVFRQQQHNWYVHQLSERSLPYLVVTGTVQDRVEQVTQELCGESWLRHGLP
jgi:HTH-type transcriptional regulator, transcriptional repressor of NAD biosynthesis genes